MHINEIYKQSAEKQGKIRVMSMAETVFANLRYQVDYMNRCDDKSIIEAIASAEVCLNELKYAFGYVKCENALYKVLKEKERKLHE